MSLSKSEFHRSACLFWLYIFFFLLPFTKIGVDYPILFAFISYAYYRLKVPDASFFKRGTMLALAVFVLICLVSVFAAGPYFNKSMKAFIFKWCQNFAVFVMAADLLREESAWQGVKKCFLIGLSLILTDGMIQLVTGREYLWNRHMTEIQLAYPDLPVKVFHAVTGTFKHCNDFSAYLVFFSIFLWTSFQRRKTKKDLFYFAGMITSTLLIIFTYSRGAWIAFAVGIFISLIFLRAGRTQMVLMGSMLTFLLAAPPVRERLLYSLKAYGDSERFELFRLTWKIIKQSPWFGNGLGTFMDYSSLLSGGKIVKYAHNCFLQIWAESGIFALAAFLIFSGLILKNGLQKFMKSKDREILALSAALAAFLIHSAFDTQLYSLQLSALFWAMSGFTMARIYRDEK